MNFLNNIRRILFREDHVCPWWLAYSFDNPLRRFLHDPDAMLSPYVKEGMTVADIGCGMGYFSLAMARLVGERGIVISADIQPEMLQKLEKRAHQRGLLNRIKRVLARKDDLGFKGPVDFVLAFWMVHETGDIPAFLERVRSVLREQGMVLIAEPRMHVSAKDFDTTLKYARNAGFSVQDGPRIGISRSVILIKP